MSTNYMLSGALPSDYLSTDEPDINVMAPETVSADPTESSDDKTKEDQNQSGPSIGRITFVSCATGSEDTAALPPAPPSVSPVSLSQDNLSSGMY